MAQRSSTHALVIAFRKWAYLVVNGLVVALGLAISIALPIIFPSVRGNTQASIGASLIAAGIVGFFLYFNYRLELIHDTKREIYSAWGILDIHEERANKLRYGALLKKAARSVDVLALSLGRLSDDFMGALKDLDARGVPMRMLVLDPSSRAMETVESEGKVVNDRRTVRTRATATIEKLKSANLKNLTLRVYWCTPYVNYFRIDGRTFLGPHLTCKPSRDTVTFLTETYGRLALEFEENFETIWREFSADA